MPTPTTSPPPATTRIEATTDGRRAGVRMGGGVLRVVVLERGPRRVSVALVPTTALLLAGDRVRIELRVGEGCLLEVTEPAGTVAYDMRGDAGRWQVDVQVADGAGLVWQAPEFVVSQGAHVERRTTVRLAGDASCLLRETLVLGRTGEGPGRLVATTSVTRDDLPVLQERLVAGPQTQVPGILGGHRVIDQVLDLGSPVDPTGTDPTGTDPAVSGPTQDPPPMLLAAGGRLHRRLADAAHEGCLDDIWAGLAAGHRAGSVAAGTDSGRIAT
ncbi:urease accessory protein UreD [Nocardioides campestrisoli]|uniref:urease accessory protein UreD n=1 Tax=Nocardioides campestrisoli TaxID=2736757 RepID=UPI0015E7A1D9|nr:urease accessory protein UreD [Nocardioides campestrisoli]